MRQVSEHVPERLGWRLGRPSPNWTPLPDRSTHRSPMSTTGIHRLDNVVMMMDRAVWSADTLRQFPLAGLRTVDRLARGEAPQNVIDLGIRTATWP